MVFIALERGPKSNPRFPLGCNWKEGGRVQGGVQDGVLSARGKAGYLWCLTAGSASFAEHLETFTPPFPCLTGRPRSPVLGHFGASGVTFRQAWASLGLRLLQYSLPLLPSPALCMIRCYFPEACRLG